jgi:hypothetical protein
VQQTWNIKSRAHECARTTRAFEVGESFFTAIYFDTESGEFVRRDVSVDAWQEEIAERTPLASWRTVYEKPEAAPPKPEFATKEGPEGLLRRLIDEDQEHTEHARYILALMLERKKLLAPRETKHTSAARRPPNLRAPPTDVRCAAGCAGLRDPTGTGRARQLSATRRILAGSR